MGLGYGSMGQRSAVRSSVRQWIVLVVALAASLAGAQQKLTLDRLYSLPSVIGTRPEQPVWSPDSRRLAFLWNDEGTPFLDVWMTDTAGGSPMRVTRMPRLPYSADAGMDVAKLEQRAKYESDHGIASVCWGPDGQSLLFVFRGQLYRVTPGSAPEMIADRKGVGLVAVSESAGMVAYVAGGDLFAVSLAAGEPTARRQYSAGRKDVGVGRLWWSPNGTRLAFEEVDRSAIPVRGIPDYLTPETTLREVKRAFPGEPAAKTRVGIIAAGGGPVQWLALGDDLQDLVWDVSWSPDGQKLLVDKSDLYIKDRRLMTVDAATGATKVLVREQNPRNVTAEWWSGWATDGLGVYFVSDFQPGATDYQVYYQALAGGAARAITAGDWAVSAVQQAGRALVVTGNRGRREERQVFRVAGAEAPLEQVTTLAGTHTTVASPDGLWIADVFSSESIPPDLYLAQAGKPERQVTHSAPPEFTRYQWVAAQYIDFPNVHDGTMLHGRLTLPVGYQPGKKYPLIVGSVYSNSVRNQWGGRIFHPTWGLDQYLAQEGYVLLNVDISGSDGYGRAFRERLAEDYGGVDVEDLYSGVQWLIQRGYVDPARVGIWGSSYGGLLTTTSLFVHPETYKAGVAGAPATSLFHAMTGEMRTMMAPRDYQAQYAKSSAFLKSGGLEGHLMIIQGMRDEVVLFKDSVVLEQRLILQGKDATLVPLPDAPHGWDTEGLAQTRFAYRKLVDYFALWLKGSAAPARQ